MLAADDRLFQRLRRPLEERSLERCRAARDQRDVAGRERLVRAAVEQFDRRILRVMLAQRLDQVAVSDAMLVKAAELCMALGTDGLRGELTLMRAARAVAAIEGTKSVALDHLKRVAPASLRHRLRRNPLDDSGSSVRVERALAERFAA